MKPGILIVFCFVLFSANISFAQWQTVYQDSSQFQFNTVYFLNTPSKEIEKPLKIKAEYESEK